LSGATKEAAAGKSRRRRAQAQRYNRGVAAKKVLLSWVLVGALSVGRASSAVLAGSHSNIAVGAPQRRDRKRRSKEGRDKKIGEKVQT
jgi:hypothetical protein